MIHNGLEIVYRSEELLGRRKGFRILSLSGHTSQIKSSKMRYLSAGCVEGPYFVIQVVNQFGL